MLQVSWKKSFSELSVIENKFQSTILEERLNYLSFFSNSVTKSVSHEEAITDYATKKCRQINTEVYQADD